MKDNQAILPLHQDPKQDKTYQQTVQENENNHPLEFLHLIWYRQNESEHYQ